MTLYEWILKRHVRNIRNRLESNTYLLQEAYELRAKGDLPTESDVIASLERDQDDLLAEWSRWDPVNAFKGQLAHLDFTEREVEMLYDATSVLAWENKWSVQDVQSMMDKLHEARESLQLRKTVEELAR